MVSSAEVQLLMSGGLDSAACAKLFIDQGLNTSALFIEYGQPAAQLEWTAVQRIAGHYGIGVDRVTVDHQATVGTGEIAGRNIFFVTTALTFGAGNGAIALGIHAGTGYWDCSPEFIAQASSIVERATNGGRSFLAPFAEWTKRDIFDFAVSRSVPIDMTYSCEAGSPGGCGKCRSCADRRAIGWLQST